MTQNSTPATRLAHRRPLFWEIGEEQIPAALVNNDDWAIVRIFQYGDLADIFDCIELYGEDKVADVISSSKLRPMAYSMGYLFLGVDPQNRYA